MCRVLTTRENTPLNLVQIGAVVEENEDADRRKDRDDEFMVLSLILIQSMMFVAEIKKGWLPPVAFR